MGNTPSISCGQGTQLEGSQCVPINTLSCGEGTYREDSADGSYCVADMFVGSTLSCGPGTKVVQNECVYDAAAAAARAVAAARAARKAG